jgi:regulatory protein
VPGRDAARSKTKGCHERALGLLAVRSRSRRELERRLLQAGFDAAEVFDELVRLEEVGLIDDEAFARQVVDHEIAGRRSGRRRVASVLARSGVSSSVLEGAISGMDDDGEEDRARDLATARARRLGGLEPSKAFGRLTAYLMRRGYAPDLARRASRHALELDRSD